MSGQLTLIAMVVLALAVALSNAAFIPETCEDQRAQLQNRSPLKTFGNYLDCRHNKNLASYRDQEVADKLVARFETEFNEAGNNQLRADFLRDMLESWRARYSNEVTFAPDSKAMLLLDNQYVSRTSLSHWQGTSRSCSVVFSSYASQKARKDFVELYEKKRSASEIAEEDRKLLEEIGNFFAKTCATLRDSCEQFTKDFDHFFKIGDPMRRIYVAFTKDANDGKKKLKSEQDQVFGLTQFSSGLDEQTTVILASLFQLSKSAPEQQCNLNTLEQMSSLFACYQQDQNAITAKSLKPIFKMVGEWFDKCIDQTFTAYEKKADIKTIKQLMTDTGIYDVKSKTHNNNVAMGIITAIKEKQLGESRDFTTIIDPESVVAFRNLMIDEKLVNMCRAIDAPNKRRHFMLFLNVLFNRNDRLFDSQSKNLASLIRERPGLYNSLFLCNVLEGAKLVDERVELMPDYENFAKSWPQDSYNIKV